MFFDKNIVINNLNCKSNMQSDKIIEIKLQIGKK